MDQEDKNQVIEVVANGILNSLNINGILEATKTYSMSMAKQRVEVMSEEELNETLDKIKDAVKEAEENKTKATEESVDQATEEASTTSQPA